MQSPGWSQVSLWVDDDRVVAGAIIEPEGYYWCQSWDSSGLVASALAAAQRWEVSPGHPPAEDMSFMVFITWLRTLLDLVPPALTRLDLAGAQMIPVEDKRDGLRRFVANGSPSGEITTLEWATLRVDRWELESDPGLSRHLRALVRSYRAKDLPLPSVPKADAALESEASGDVTDDWVLGRDAFVGVVLDLARQPHQPGLLESLLEAADPAMSAFGLQRLLERTVAAARPELDPFAGIMEGPPELAVLYERYGRDLSLIREDHAPVITGLLHDVAEMFFDGVRNGLGPIHWRIRGADPKPSKRLTHSTDDEEW